VIIRSSIVDCAIKVAHAMAERSEDPWTKVGCVALTSDNRMIATAYNGLLPGFSLQKLLEELTPDGFPSDEWPDGLRDSRLPFMVHAEQNLCSLIKRYEASWIVTTVCPCANCLLLLACYGIKKVVYTSEYCRDNRAKSIAAFYHLELIKA
jgi:dCMP deaminase